MSALARRWKQCYLGGGWVGNRGTKATRSTRPHRSTHPHLQTNSKAQTPRLQQKRWLLLFRKASSFRAVCVFSFHFVFNFNCAACCLRLLDVVPVVSRSLHRLARCLRAALRRYSSGAARKRLCCYYTAVLFTCVRMVSVVVCVTHATVQTRDLNTHSAVGGTRTFCSNEHVVTTPMCRLYLRPD